MPGEKKRKPRKKKFKEPPFEERMEDFGKEMEKLGRNFAKHMEKHGKEFGEDFEIGIRKCERRRHGVFGIIGPLIGAVIGLIILLIIITIFDYLSFVTGWLFFSGLRNFFYQNIGFFFIAGLFFSYSDWFGKFYPKAFKPFSPIVKALGLSFAIWIVINILMALNLSLENPQIAIITEFSMKYLFWALAIFIAIGYIVLLLSEIGKEPEKGGVRMPVEKRKRSESTKSGVKRLYRSGKDKVLGGVCGGIGEYLGVDPVLIRLIWIACSIFPFFWGGGIILYIIAWIIIPRNPSHEWD